MPRTRLGSACALAACHATGHHPAGLKAAIALEGRPMRRLLVLAVLPVLGWAAYRRNAVVRVIRALDRRGGLASAHGEKAYAAAAGMFGGLHARAAEDAVSTLGEGGTLVDIGAGPGDVLALVAARAPTIRRIGVEPSAAMRSIAASRGIDELAGSAESLPLPEASVDLAVSTLSAHHWADPAAAFREIARVLRPGGRARIYDVRFAAFSIDEARGIAAAAGIHPARVRRDVLSDRLFGVRPYCVITLTP